MARTIAATPSYGIDAPGIIRNLVIVGLAAAIVA